MRIFKFSELWGPFNCEYDGCDKDTFDILLTDIENDNLPDQYGPTAASHIIYHKFGCALCDEHMPKEQ